MLSFRKIKLRDVLTKSLGNGFQIAEVSKDPMHCTWRDKPTCRYQGKLQFVKSNTKWRENGCPSNSNLWFCWLSQISVYVLSKTCQSPKRVYSFNSEKWCAFAKRIAYIHSYNTEGSIYCPFFILKGVISVLLLFISRNVSIPKKSIDDWPCNRYSLTVLIQIIAS